MLKKHCNPGTFVLDPNHRVGMVFWRGRSAIGVKYGADGPQRYWPYKALQPANPLDVETAGLSGVGGIYVETNS